MDLEKETDIMRKEIQIVLPFYKIAYSFSFIVILSLIRGVTYTYEIGIAIEVPMAILATVFCADTYVREIISKRSEIHRLYPIKKRFFSILNRILIQEIFLLLLAIIGYGFFFVFQKPSVYSETGSVRKQFMIYLFALTITLFSWGILANTLSMFFRNMWLGIGGCLLVWLATDSTWGDKYLGAWNIFSYTFRNAENDRDITWLYGKILCVCVCVILMVALPKIIKKRG